jgi:hypothetical protein
MKTPAPEPKSYTAPRDPKGGQVRVEHEDFDFTYTTPSARKQHSKAAQREMGCEWKTKQYVSKKGKRRGQVVEKQVPADFSREECLDAATPCNTVRTLCPVQFVWKGGKPALRFCLKSGNKKPGWLVPVSSPQEAQRIANEACACWTKSGPSHKSRKFLPSCPGAMAVIEKAQRAFPESGGLGGRAAAQKHYKPLGAAERRLEHLTEAPVRAKLPWNFL